MCLLLGLIFWSPLEQLCTLRTSFSVLSVLMRELTSFHFMQLVGVMEPVENDQSHVKFMELMGCVWWMGEFIAAQGGMNLLANTLIACKNTARCSLQVVLAPHC